jgi:protein-S-isoprenylcysteine O-methyltransferase Ste14
MWWMPSPLTSPGVRFPPPFIYAAAFLGGLAIERWVVQLPISSAVTRSGLVVVAWLAIVAGGVIAVSGAVSFRFARTAIIPFHPASHLVRSGPYRFTRNPMYLGLAVFYAGLALLFDKGVPLLLLPVAIWAMQVLVIHREERYLADAFGDDYRLYQREVRRWI